MDKRTGDSEGLGGSLAGRDYIGGDQVSGDKIGRDKIVHAGGEAARAPTAGPGSAPTLDPAPARTATKRRSAVVITLGIALATAVVVVFVVLASSGRIAWPLAIACAALGASGLVAISNMIASHLRG